MFKNFSFILTFFLIPVIALVLVLFVSFEALKHTRNTLVAETKKGLTDGNELMLATLEENGIDALKAIAEDAAMKLDIYLTEHPNTTGDELAADAFVQNITTAKHLGLGYLALNIAEESKIISHPDKSLLGVHLLIDPKLQGSEFAELRSLLTRISRLESASGKYTFFRPDGTIVEKYLAGAITEHTTVEGNHISALATVELSDYIPELTEAKAKLDFDVAELTHTSNTTVIPFIVVFILMITILVGNAFFVRHYLKTHNTRSMRRQAGYLATTVTLLLVLSASAHTTYRFYAEYKQISEDASEILERSIIYTNAQLSTQIAGYTSNRARHGKEQADAYLKFNPDLTLQDMYGNATLEKIAHAPVGKTGYTFIASTQDITNIVHPNKKIIGKSIIYDPAFSANLFADLVSLVRTATTGKTIAGNYEWTEADGRITEKYLAAESTKNTTADGKTLFIAATTYADDFNYSKDAIRASLNKSIQSIAPSAEKNLRNLLLTTLGIFLVTIITMAISLHFTRFPK